MIAEEEVRPFLTAHFLIARMFSKVLSRVEELPVIRTQYMVCALHRYQWLLTAAPRVCEKKNQSLDDLFGEEMAVSREMAQLLPSKIDRMHYLGEGGL